MAIETWNSSYIVIWLCLGTLMMVLIFGVRGYNGKVTKLGATGYSVIINSLALLNGVALGQTMYDETAKYDFWGSIGTVLGLSLPLLISGFILIIFYRYRVIKYPGEIVVKGANLEISKNYLLGGIIWFMFSGLLSAGIGSMYIIMALVGDRRGVIYGIIGLMPPIVAIWLVTKYRKWIFKYIVWVLRRKGLLQVTNEDNSD